MCLLGLGGLHRKVRVLDHGSVCALDTVLMGLSFLLTLRFKLRFGVFVLTSQEQALAGTASGGEDCSMDWVLHR
jgi:hypothetical protein